MVRMQTRKTKEEETSKVKEEVLEKETNISNSSISHDPVRMKWKEESRLVKGIFRCHEPRGGSVTFSFKKYKWDPTKTYTLVDGHEYELPLAVARHLNQNCNYSVHQHILDSQGKPILDVGGKQVSRMNFESLEFAY